MRSTVRTEISFAAQTPDPKTPGIGMALLQMINLQHHGQPHLAHRGMRGGALVGEAGCIVAFERVIHRVIVGRETCKNCLILRLLQPWA